MCRAPLTLGHASPVIAWACGCIKALQETSLRQRGRSLCTMADPGGAENGAVELGSPDGTVPTGTMSMRRLRSEDYNDYSSTDVSPEGSPPDGINGFAHPDSYQRFGETNGTT